MSCVLKLTGNKSNRQSATPIGLSFTVIINPCACVSFNNTYFTLFKKWLMDYGLSYNLGRSPVCKRFTEHVKL